jgi:hypothetical protein
MHLMIKHPDHYPQDPYLYMQVYDAGQFVLPANTPPPTSAPNAQDAIPTLTPPAPFTRKQTPMPGTVTQEVRTSEGMTVGLFYCANSEIDAIVEVGSSAFVHTIAHPDEEESNEDETVNLMQEALAYVTAKREQKRGTKGNLMALRYRPVRAHAHSPPQNRQWLRMRLSRQKSKHQVQKAKDWRSRKSRCIMYLSLTILQRELPWRLKALCLHPRNQPHCPPIILHPRNLHLRYLCLPHNRLPIAMHLH